MIIEELAKYGIAHTDEKTIVDGSPAKLVEMALSHKEGILTSTGCLAVTTGAYTGRSPHGAAREERSRALRSRRLRV